VPSVIRDFWKDVLFVSVPTKRLDFPSLAFRTPFFQRFGPVLAWRLERPVVLGPATSDSERYRRYVFDAHRGNEIRYL
jgi:hypothetical protein